MHSDTGSSTHCSITVIRSNNDTTVVAPNDRMISTRNSLNRGFSNTSNDEFSTTDTLLLTYSTSSTNVDLNFKLCMKAEDDRQT